MQDYCIRKELEMNTISFLFDGNRLSETQTPAELNMEDDDMIEARYTRKLPAADDFAAALEAVPADDWSRTWAADRTITLRRTSKRVKEVVDKMRLPAVVLLSRSFWDDARNGTAAEKLDFVFKQLAALTDQCRISTLKLPRCEIKEQDVERLAGVLAQCPALAHLDLSDNHLYDAGAESLAGVLGQCRETTTQQTLVFIHKDIVRARDSCDAKLTFHFLFTISCVWSNVT
jgi:small ubiquitin-related modifier